MRQNLLEAITLTGIVLGGRCPEIICPRGQLSQEVIVRDFTGGNYLGEGVNCLRGNFPKWESSGEANCLEDICPRWQELCRRQLSWRKLSGRQLPQVGIVPGAIALGGNYPGSIFPEGNCLGDNCPEEIVLFPHLTHML